MIDIKPDRNRPRGGFAEITVSVSDTGDNHEVTVFNSFLQKWLGPSGWQPNQHSFAPRQISQDGDQLRLIIGPDVVNQIEEDTPVKIGIGNASFDTYWPDDINHGPDVALEGDLAGTGAKAQAAQAKPMVKRAEPEPEPEPAPVIEDVDTPEIEPEPIEDEEVTVDPEPRKGRAGKLMWAIALIPILIAGAWLFLQNQTTAPADKTLPKITEIPAVASKCDAAKLTELAAEGFGEVAAQIRLCGAEVSADDALGFIERAAASNDGAALSLFGALYDTQVADEAIEDKIGLTFGDDPARAAEYYDRAVQAGNAKASERLTAVCRRLLLKNDTLSQSAHEDYCK